MRKLMALLTAIFVAVFPVGEPLRADDLMLLLGSNGHAAVAPPPSCSNKLDFSAACNSQYINIVGI